MATGTVKWFNDDQDFATTRTSDSSHRITPARTCSELHNK